MTNKEKYDTIQHVTESLTKLTEKKLKIMIKRLDRLGSLWYDKREERNPPLAQPEEGKRLKFVPVSVRIWCGGPWLIIQSTNRYVRRWYNDGRYWWHDFWRGLRQAQPQVSDVNRGFKPLEMAP